MKKLFFALSAFALTLAVTPSQAAVPPTQCSAFCATVRCLDGYICGIYTNSSGQTLCGCHPRPVRP